MFNKARSISPAGKIKQNLRNINLEAFLKQLNHMCNE